MPDVQEGVARLQALLEDSTLPTGLCLQISAWQGTLSPLQRTRGSSEPGKGDNGVGCRPARVVLPMGTVWAKVAEGGEAHGGPASCLGGRPQP